jgi:dephospho-CoA kinase
VSGWPGKYIIGLTGNIATGKSVVRKMLEYLGAYGIDADALSHRAIAPGSPGYQKVIDIFGKWIVDENGEIDRARLGRLVFTDPEALQQLEGIVHPLVERDIDMMIQRADQRVIVIEAIKLFEGNLAGSCDTIWTTYAPESIQKARLMQKRNMSKHEALQRIHAQPPQKVKTAAANVIIKNSGSFEDTWKQVVAGWEDIAPVAGTRPVGIKKPAVGRLTVQRGRQRDAAKIAAFITRLSGGTNSQSRDGITAALGEKASQLLWADKQLVRLIGWQVENLVAHITDLYIEAGIPVEKALKDLVCAVERALQDLECEALLFFLPTQATGQESVWQGMGYTRRTLQTLEIQTWRDAAIEWQPPDTILLFKHLRQDNLLPPIEPGDLVWR